ncbi:MAG: thioredoxin [Acidobacteriota bacterium]
MATQHAQWVIEVDEQQFPSQVIERSRELPVLVDFWAEWCAPCRMLGPMLERLAEEFQGAFLLAKVDTEGAPALAQAFQIRSIPYVVMFKDGKPVDAFVGALPEPELRQFIQQYCTTETDELARQGEQRLEAGKIAEAEQLFQRALGDQPEHPAAMLGLAEVAFRKDDFEEAERLLSRVLPVDGAGEKLDRLRARIRFRREALELGPLEEARRKQAEEPDDLERTYALAVCLVDSGAYEEALELFLQIVKRDRKFRDDGARKAMVDVFPIVGIRSPLAEKIRSRLSALLF